MKNEIVINDDAQLNIDDNILKFDNILKIVGDYGKFQRLFNWVFNFYYTVALSMTFLNHILAVQTPEHWCYVPGRPNNITIEQWRLLTIPPDINTKGENTFSKCFMYKQPCELGQNTRPEIIGCQYGWEYNRTWYEETLTSSENWVCENEYYVTNSLTIGRLGDFFGTLVFGYLGDVLVICRQARQENVLNLLGVNSYLCRIGRRPIFIIAIFGMFSTRIIMLLTKTNYTMFMFASFLGYITMTAGFRPPLTITLEISNKHYRAMVVSMHYLGWAVGECLLPLIMWTFRRADYFMIITSLPGILVLVIFRYLIESPRWLLNRHKIDECYRQLKIIARVNKKHLPDDLILKLKQLTSCEKLDNLSGSFLSLFSHWRLAKNTIILAISWAVTFLGHQILMYYIEILYGNPFINFFLQAIIQFPGCILGKILCDRYTRRFSLLFSHLGTAVATLAMILFIKEINYPYIPVVLAVCVKFFISMAHYITNLQALEIYPTSLRQTGSSFCVVCGLALAISTPYITLLGKTYDARYPYVILCFTLIIAAISGTFLPETKNKNLPETLNEAREFGSKQSYFNFLKS